jgi:hypothetical protein
MKQQTLSKILNKDGSIKFKFLNTKYAQKYLTLEELNYLNSCPGGSLHEKYNYLTKDIQKNTQISSQISSQIPQKEPEQKIEISPYYYQSEQFDSAQELAFWIYHRDHKHAIRRNYKKLFYFYKRKKRYIIPDFILDKKLIEVKGDNFKKGLEWNKLWPYEEKVLKKHNVAILWHDDIKPFLYYIRGKYGAKYLKSFKQKTCRDYKRKIIPVDTVEDAFPYRNDNVKFSYTCKKCGRKVITTYFILDHFKDYLCKKCRKAN